MGLGKKSIHIRCLLNFSEGTSELDPSGGTPWGDDGPPASGEIDNPFIPASRSVKEKGNQRIDKENIDSLGAYWVSSHRLAYEEDERLSQVLVWYQ